MAEFIGKHLAQPVRSMAELHKTLQLNDFARNIQEIERRDQFYREQLDTGRTRRLTVQSDAPDVQPSDTVVAPPPEDNDMEETHWYKTHLAQDEETMRHLRRYLMTQPITSSVWCNELDTLFVIHIGKWMTTLLVAS